MIYTENVLQYFFSPFVFCSKVVLGFSIFFNEKKIRFNEVMRLVSAETTKHRHSIGCNCVQWQQRKIHPILAQAVLKGLSNDRYNQLASHE